MDAQWVRQHLVVTHGLPHVDWNAAGPLVEAGAAGTGRHEAWTDAAREWLRALREALGGAYQLDESDHLMVVSGFSGEKARMFECSLEATRALILEKLLPGIADGNGPGKQVVLALRDSETYTSYIAHYYPSEGSFAATGGLSVSPTHGGGGGYGHVIVHGKQPVDLERIVAHELTHDLVCHLPLPLWLNEGLATGVESHVMRDGALVVVPEDLEEHRARWRDGGIQDFWSGAAFSHPDASGLAYDLARMARRALSRDFERFRKFVLAADWSDAGEAAARDVYEGGLGGLIQQFLGPGEWTPAPRLWSDAHDAGPES